MRRVRQRGKCGPITLQETAARMPASFSGQVEETDISALIPLVWAASLTDRTISCDRCVVAAVFLKPIPYPGHPVPSCLPCRKAPRWRKLANFFSAELHRLTPFYVSAAPGSDVIISICHRDLRVIRESPPHLHYLQCKSFPTFRNHLESPTFVPTS